MKDYLFFTNEMLKMIFFGSMRFFTTWGLLLLLLFIIGFFKNYQASIFLLLLTIFYIGSIITYIFPRVIKVPYINRTISGTMLKIFNLLFHVFPLFIFLLMYDVRIKQDDLFLAFFGLLIYVLIVNPFKVYNYNCNKCFEKNISNVLIILYALVIGILIKKQNKLF